MIDRNYNRTRNILDENIDILHKLAELLLEKETITGKELDALILDMRPGIEFPAREAGA